MLHRSSFLVLAALLSSLAPAAFAQSAVAAAADTTQPGETIIVSVSPLDPGTQAELVPAAVSHLDNDDLTRTGTADVIGAMNARLGGVTLDEAQANPFQPNLLYRGFEASPLPGNAQGLAVYVGGSRFNQAFGDTVDWDLIPDMAVSAVDVVSSNPAFGLNALGGAVSVHLKNGFDNPGGTAEASAGSFGRERLGLEYGVAQRGVSFYVATTGLDDDGWRDFSPSRLRQAYSDIGWREGDNEVHASFQFADNSLTGNGSSPVELLDYDRSAVFTHPDTTDNKYGRFALTGDFNIASWRLRTQAYAARLDRHTVNGDAAEVEPCDFDDDQLCSSEEDDVELTDINGDEVDNFITNSPYADDFDQFEEGGPYAFLNRTNTATTSYGASAQISRELNLFGLTHRISAGASFDGAKTNFRAGTTISGLSEDRGWFGPGIEIDTPDANITPVSVRVTTEYYGLFLSDAFDLTRDLTATLTARANEANIKLEDQIGTALNGDRTFRRIDPALGLSYRVDDTLTVYGGYSEASRAPTPAELSCADPDAPCSLANFFVADPPLDQVVGRTGEIGLRGQFDRYAISFNWHAGLYRNDLSDDIQFVLSTTAGRGFFTNVGKTRRQGAELGVSGAIGQLEAYADYAWTDATYRTSFNLAAGANPAFDDEDDIMTVQSGDRRPGIPEHSLKAGIDWQPANNWTLGVDGVYSSGRYLVGDEANLNPKTDAYFLANAHLKWRAAPGVELFAEVRNLFDEEYETFGTFSPVGAVPIIGLGELENPRSLSPGAPRAGYAGVRVRF